MDEQLNSTQKYQYYAYPDAVRDLGLNNQVMFVYQGAVLADKRGLHLGEALVPYTDLRKPTPGWKLCAELFETDGQYALKLSYSTADYSEAFLQQLAETYSNILRSMVTAETVSEIAYCSDEQVKWLDALNPAAPKAVEGSLVARFKEHVKKQPNAICVVAGETRLTYAEVDRLSDTIDPHYTERCGDHVIGYSVPRNEQMIIVPLSIAKAGMTAMPLDSSYPAERLDFMRSDAAQYEGGDAFILLYTSGTTGTPKGVMLSEQNILTFCDFHTKHIGLTSESRYATYAGYGFDAFMHDLWGCMTAGAAMYVIGDDIRFDLEAIHEYFVKEAITHTFMTTQVATQLVQNFPDIPSLKFVGTGGEKLMSLDPPSYTLQNGYGPTECTVYVSSYWVEKNEPNIPIGRANDTAQLYIVNKYGTHLVTTSALGGKLDYYFTLSQSVKTEVEQLVTTIQVKVLFVKKSSTSVEEHVWQEIKTDFEASFQLRGGGAIGEKLSKKLQDLSDNGTMLSEADGPLFEQWDLRFADVENVDPDDLVMVNFQVMPIWEIIEPLNPTKAAEVEEYVMETYLKK